MNLKKRFMTVLLALVMLFCTLAPAQSGTAAAALAAVTLTSISSSAYNKITVSWEKVTGATSYRIYYKATGSTAKWKRIATVKAPKLSYTHVSSKSYPISLGRNYTYTVRAYNSKTKKLGGYNKTGLTTHTLPGRVTMRKAVWNSGLDSVTVTWRAAKGGTYYRIYRKTPSSPNWKCIGTVPSGTLKFVDKNPSAEERNYYTVRAGNKKAKVTGKFSSSYVTASSKQAAENDRTAALLKKTKTAGKTSQIILVVDHNLSFWEKNASGHWIRKLSVYCGYGSNGLSEDRHEGDRTTPIGSFPILHGFGIAANPGTTLQYRRITGNSYWSGEYSTYNQWVESSRSVAGEHLIDYYQYKYAMAIGFNRNPTVYKKGSAIFLHCKSTDHWSTAGCVSVENSVMKKLLLMSRNGVYIVIVKDLADISNY